MASLTWYKSFVSNYFSHEINFWNQLLWPKEPLSVYMSNSLRSQSFNTESQPPFLFYFIFYYYYYYQIEQEDVSRTGMVHVSPWRWRIWFALFLFTQTQFKLKTPSSIFDLFESSSLWTMGSLHGWCFLVHVEFAILIVFLSRSMTWVRWHPEHQVSLKCQELEFLQMFYKYSPPSPPWPLGALGSYFISSYSLKINKFWNISETRSINVTSDNYFS